MKYDTKKEAKMEAVVKSSLLAWALQLALHLPQAVAQISHEAPHELAARPLGLRLSTHRRFQLVLKCLESGLKMR